MLDVLLLATALSPAALAFEPPPLRAVTFNIRYGSASDGPDRWDLRRPRVVRTIEALDAAVIGLQEAEAFQVRELLEALPRYAAAGVGRDDGRARGEACTILYDRRRFTLAETATFWLSETPETIGSKGWDAALPRVCTWARLVELDGGAACYVFNLHLDHRGASARTASTVLVRARMQEITTRKGLEAAAILIGDFNAGEDDVAITSLLAERDDDPLALIDAWRAIHPTDRAGTFTAFDLASDGGSRRIDHVFVTSGWRVRDAGIDRRRVDDRWPSDHFPVWVELARD